MKEEKIVELIRIPNIVVTKQEAAERVGVDQRTIQNYMNEIEGLKDRYGDLATSRAHGYSLINILVLYDYLHFRPMLRQKNLRKNVPSYNPTRWIKELALDQILE